MGRLAPLIGRVLLALIFVLSGGMKFMDMGAAVGYGEAYGLPAPGLLVPIAGVLEVVGGLAIMAGFKARLAALALFLFLIPTTLVFHTDFSDQTQMAMFLKNVSIMGGLLLLYAYGPGAKTVD